MNAEGKENAINPIVVGNVNNRHSGFNSTMENKKPLNIPALQSRTHAAINPLRVKATTSTASPGLNIPPLQSNINATKQNNKCNESSPSLTSRSFNSIDINGSDFKWSANRSSSSKKLSRGRRVLRLGETVESLFQLEGMPADSEYWTYCRSLGDLGLKNNEDDEAAEISLWRIILETASIHVASHPTSSSNKHTRNGQQLTRLYRRATSQLGIDSTKMLPEKSSHDLFLIWFGYAKHLLAHGAEQDARVTFRHMKSHKLGEHHADFYLAHAELERKFSSSSKAQEILLDGIRKKAEPLMKLHGAIRNLEERIESKMDFMHSPKRLKTERGRIDLKETEQNEDDNNESFVTESSNMSLSLSFDDESVKEELPDDQNNEKNTAKESINFQLVPLTRRENGGKFSELKPTTFDTTIDQSKDFPSLDISTKPDSTNFPSDQFYIRPTSKSQPYDITNIGNEGEANKASFVSEKKLMSTQVDFQSGTKFNSHLPHGHFRHNKSSQGRIRDRISSRISQDRTLRNSSKLGVLAAKGVMNSTRPPLLSKLNRIPNLGKAQRLDPNQACGVDSDDSDVEHEDVESAEEKSEQAPKPKQKTVKMDLSYMMNWDPNRRFKSNGTENSKNQSTNDPIIFEKIEDAPSTQSSENHSAETPGDTKTNISKEVKSNDSKKDDNEAKTVEIQKSRRMDEEHPLRPKSDGVSSKGTPAESKPSEGKYNPDFLPLVRESNVLRVNGLSYLKLGVIGKGGSCKVYRALSKDGSVVAIKKVKLAGMDQKAIDGYANEIQLLKRLKGNPSIIQLYDSEKDLKRKAIFLVMEQGEVDLNHVLQKQATQSKASGMGLNMNFIRLTWQQMLSAVHSIHEERIIHGDLKPANFIFVRGALKLIDFGIAKAIQSEDTTNIYRESQIGTINYMSPEAILEDQTASTKGPRMKCGRASDIWSLGCILYQMVYGKTPFADLHMLQKIQAIANPNYKIKFPYNVDESAVDAIQQCLRWKAESRPPIVGPSGLLNDHRFLISQSSRKS